MKILLINSNLKDDFLAAPPIGLCYVASAAEEAGHEVQVLDLCFKHQIRQELEQAIDGFSPQIIGISLRNLDNANMLHPVIYLPTVRYIIEVIRRFSAAPLVLGGSGASLDPQGVLEYLNADYVVVADGERSFIDLLENLSRDESPARIPGVGSRQQGKFQLSTPRLPGIPPGNPNLGRWIDMAPYEKIGSSYTIQTKRGCRSRCIYCTYNQVLEGNRLRLRPPQEVVDEIEEAYYRFSPHTFEFVDSVFNDPLDHCGEILMEILRRPWKAQFTAMGVSPKNLNKELLRLMERAGFKNFMITPDSGSETMLAQYQKGFGIDDLYRAAESINKFSFPVFWYFLLGGPGETSATVRETLEFIGNNLIRRERPPYNLAHIFLGIRIYQGTKLWQIALQESMITHQSDPLTPLWYLSPHLNLDETVHQLHQAAHRWPEVALGDVERFFFIAKLFQILDLPQPYWQHLPKITRLLSKLHLLSLFQSRKIPTRLRELLRQQNLSPL